MDIRLWTYGRFPHGVSQGAGERPEEKLVLEGTRGTEGGKE